MPSSLALLGEKKLVTEKNLPGEQNFGEQNSAMTRFRTKLRNSVLSYLWFFHPSPIFCALVENGTKSRNISWRKFMETVACLAKESQNLCLWKGGVVLWGRDSLQ